jgi:hypothetical protein
MSDRRREKELKRRRKQGGERGPAMGSPQASPATSTVNREILARELGDPQRLVLHLKRLSELLTAVDHLRAARIPHARLLPALLALDADEIAALPEEKRGPFLREKLIPELATEHTAKLARQAIDQTLSLARDDRDRVALFAGRMFLDAWLRTKQDAHKNPAWEAIFAISLLDTLFEGHVLARLARDAWGVNAAETEAHAAKSLAKALSRAEVSKELEGLGLDRPDPQALAKEYVRLADETEKTYLLGFDSLLYLVRANAAFAVAHVKTVLAQGLTREVRAAAVAAFEDAFKNDMTKPLVDDFTNEVVRRIHALAAKPAEGETSAKAKPAADAPEAERKVALTALASIRAIPIEHNLFLKNTYVGSFDIYKGSAPTEEVPFIRRIWAEPTDRWALEEYEKFLLERRHSHRAGRVRRFLAEVRKEALEKEPKA